MGCFAGIVVRWVWLMGLAVGCYHWWVVGCKGVWVEGCWEFGNWNVGPGLGLALVACWVYDGGSGLGLRFLVAKCLALGRVWHWHLLGCCARIVVRCVWLMDVGPGLGLALVGCWV